MRKLIRAQTGARLKKLDREVRHVARKPEDADSIHDLRVSIRRFKQELEVFEEWLHGESVKTLRKQLRKLMKRCAAVRNCDVAVEILRAAGHRNAKLVASLKKEREHAADELAEKLAHWRRVDRVRKWRGHLRVAHTASKETAAEVAQRILPLMVEQLFRAGRGAAHPNSTYQRMHRVRLKAKQVRYSVELFETVYGTTTSTIIEPLKGLQEKLGEINDCAASIEMVHDDRDAAAAVRGLARKREAKFRAYWKQHFGEQEKSRWKAVLGAADRKKKWTSMFCATATPRSGKTGSRTATGSSPRRASGT